MPAYFVQEVVGGSKISQVINNLLRNDYNVDVLCVYIYMKTPSILFGKVKNRVEK